MAGAQPWLSGGRNGIALYRSLTAWDGSMLSTSRTDHASRLRAQERAVLNGGWLTIDLAALPDSSAAKQAPPTPAVSVPALPAAARTQDNVKVEALAVPTAPPKAQVPADSFVVIGSGLPRQRSFGRRRVVPPIANDNAVRAHGKKGRSAVREVFFLALLAATVVGAFCSGRVHAMQKVIVIPEPTNPRSVLT
jgi:hypothetical protein